MADTLSESQIQELKKLFDKYDRDKGGKITTSELGAMLTSLGHEMTLEEVEEIINQFDKDGNKTMDFEEFQNMMLKKVEDAKFSKEIITDFKKYDLNGDGFISPNELREVIRVRGERLSNAEVDAMMQTVDLNQDGKVNYEGNKTMDFEEFQNMMLKKVEDAKFSKEIITDFKKYDLNGDGFISPNELREVIRVRGERLSNAEVDAMMQTVDLNQDGKVNYEEFVKVMVA